MKFTQFYIIILYIYAFSPVDRRPNKSDLAIWVNSSSVSLAQNKICIFPKVRNVISPNTNDKTFLCEYNPHFHLFKT